MKQANVKTTGSVFLSDYAQIIFTNELDHKSRIKGLELHVIDNTPVNIAVWRVPANGGSPGTVAGDDVNQRIKMATSSDGGDTVWISLGWTLENENDTIQAEAGVADKVSASVDYVDITET